MCKPIPDMGYVVSVDAETIEVVIPNTAISDKNVHFETENMNKCNILQKRL